MIAKTGFCQWQSGGRKPDRLSGHHPPPNGSLAKIGLRCQAEGWGTKLIERRAAIGARSSPTTLGPASAVYHPGGPVLLPNRAETGTGLAGVTRDARRRRANEP